MESRRVISKKSITYLDLLRIYYYPDKTFSEVLDKVIEQFESDYGLKEKLLTE